MTTFNVSGITFAEKENPKVGAMRPDGIIHLLADPDNKFDKKAIKVLWKGTVLGFVPAGPVQDEIHGAWKVKRYVDAEVDSFRCMITDDGEEKWSDTKGNLQSLTIKIDTHPGYTDGKDEFVSITKLLGHLNPSGGFDALLRWAFACGNYDDYEKTLNKLANKGTALHNKIERMFLGEIKNSDSIEHFRNKYSPKVLNLEKTVYDKDIKVAGMYDAMFEIDGKKVLVDWKSSKKVQMKHKLQSAWYATVEGADEAWVVCFGGKNKCGYSVSKISKADIKKYYRVVKHLYKIYKILNTKK